MRPFYTLLALLVLNGCGLTPQHHESEFTLGIEYLDEERQGVYRDDLPTQIFVNFPVIPGAIVGAVLTEGQYSTFAYIGKTFTIDSKELLESVEPYATPLLATPYNVDTVVRPQSTKLLRVGTFAYDALSGEFLGATGLTLPGSDIHQLFLVYFDRPASLTGSFIDGEYAVEYDVHIDHAGFSWLKAVKEESSLLRVTEHKLTGNEIIFIQPPANKDKKA